MKNEEIFCTLWNNMQEDTVAAINFQIENRGTISYQELKKRYRDNLSRWSSRMSSEGAWLLEVEDEKAREEVLEAISGMELSEEKIESAGRKPIVTGGICGAGVCATTMLVQFPPLVNVAGFAVGFLVGCAIGNSSNSKEKKGQMEETKRKYIRQMEKDKDTIAAIWRKYAS